MKRKHPLVKKIPGFSKYSITVDGQVFNEDFRRYATYKKPGGYVSIHLTADTGKRSGQSVHRLVWKAWKGDIKRTVWVNHINGIKNDNRLKNLEVGTPSYNHKHAYTFLNRKRAQGETHGNAKLNNDAIEIIRLLSSSGWAAHKLARAFSVSQPTITKIVNKKAWRQVIT